MDDYNVGYDANSHEECWWESQVAGLIQGKGHHANASVSGVQMEGFEDDLKKYIGAAKLPLEVVPGISHFRPIDGEPYKVYTVYQSADKDTVVVVDMYSNYCGIRVWSTNQEIARETCKKIVAEIPVLDAPEPREDLIPMAFWQHDDRDGASCFIKDIQCPSIKEISGNYPDKVAKIVKDLGDLPKPDDLGKILIFHGPPGSGKTHAVRALAREWANYLDSTVEIVVDPELMLNSPKYIRGILLNGDKPLEARRVINKRKGKKTKKLGKNESPLRLIVIEDSAELFSDNCRGTPGFARLLNVTDGIIGQGLRCIFLLTANEELGKIDPAIKRPGRCIQCVNFPELSVTEANAWLKKNGCEQKVKHDTMLADLYAIKGAKANELTSEDKSFGFAPTSVSKA